MKNISMILIMLFLISACSGNADSDPNQTIKSTPIESMNEREASLLGLDMKSDEGWPTWTGSKIYSMEEAQSLAKQHGKKVLVEVYAVWCGYCRKMAAETHPTEIVKKAVDDLFFMVRLNAESEKQIIFNGETMTESELAAAFGVSSFPTTVFVDTNGDPLGLQPGFMDAPMYSNLLSFVGTESFKSTTFEDYVNNSKE